MVMRKRFSNAKHSIPALMMKTFSFLLAISLIFPFSIAVFSADDVANYVRKSDYLDVVISPDGNTLATRVRKGEASYIVFIDRSTLKSIGAVKSSEGDLIYDYHWVNNERIVYRLGEKSPGSDNPSLTGKMFAINIDGSKRKQLFLGLDQSVSTTNSVRLNSTKSYKKLAGTPKFLSRTDNDKKIVVGFYPWSRSGNIYYDDRSRAPELAILNTYNAKYSLVETIPYPGARLFPDQSGLVKILSYKKDDVNRLLIRSNKESEWQDLDLDAYSGSLSVSKVSKDGKFAYLWATERQGVTVLLSVNLENMSTEVIFRRDGHDLDNWIEDPISYKPAVGVFEPKSAEYQYTQEPLAKQHAMLARAFKGKRVEIDNASDDGRFLLLFVESDTNPGDYYIFDTVAKKADFLFSAMSWIDPHQMQAKEYRQFTMRDGTQIGGYLTRAKGKEKAPLVVIPHGGPHSVREYWDFDPQSQLLASRGYHVLQVNFRGSDGFGSEHRTAGYGQWGKLMVHDIVDATKALNKEALLDAEGNNCIWGSSYGAFAALAAAAEATELFKCAVGFAGVFDLKLLEEEEAGTVNESYFDKVLATDSEGWWQQAPVLRAAQIKAKVFLVHGDDDHVASIEHSERMRAALNMAGNQPKWLELDRAGHGIYDDEDRIAYYRAVLEFLDKNLQ